MAKSKDSKENKKLKKRKVVKDRYGATLTRLSLRIDLETVDELYREAREQGKSINSHINIILKDYVQSKKKKSRTKLKVIR